MAFCPLCGKKGIVGVLCSECSLKQAKVLLPKKEIKLKICSSCNSYLSKNKWTSFKNLSDLMAKLVKDAVSKKGRISIKPLLPKDLKINPGIFRNIDVQVDDSIIPLRLDVTLCSKCSKQGTQYFEGTLQLRNPSEDILDFLEARLPKMSEKGHYITKQVKMKNGFDLYFTSQKDLQSLGKELKTKFGGELKVSARLQTKDKLSSRDLYRVNVYYEAPPFSKGNILGVEDKIVRVTSLGKQITGQNVITGEKVNIDMKKGFEMLRKQDVLVSRVRPVVEVLDPDSYQSIKVSNQKDVRENTKVQIVKYKEKIYLV